MNGQCFEFHRAIISPQLAQTLRWRAKGSRNDSGNPPLAGYEVIREIFVNLVAVRALKVSRRLMWDELVGAFADTRFAWFCGESLAAGFAFHQPD
jgi:hypothetical protein